MLFVAAAVLLAAVVVVVLPHIVQVPLQAGFLVILLGLVVRLPGLTRLGQMTDPPALAVAVVECGQG